MALNSDTLANETIQFKHGVGSTKKRKRAFATLQWPSKQKLALYVTLSSIAIILCLPFYYMMVTAFKSSEELASLTINLGITQPTLEPIRMLLDGTIYIKAAFNSFWVAFFITFGNIILCPLAGYAFVQHQFPGRDKIFIALLATMMIPGAVLLVPSFLLARDFGWINTYLPIIIPVLASPFYVFLSRQFIAKIPDAIIKAARIDGCSELRIFFQIVLPLCKPLMASIGILSFLSAWNSFIGPMIFLLEEESYTLPLVIGLLQGKFGGFENVQMAGALLSIVPVLVVFFIFQKKIIESFASSGMKE